MNPTLKKMKIIYGITKSNFGGAQHYVLDLASEMKKKKCDVVVLCGGNGVLIRKLRKEEVEVISLDNLHRDISIFREISSFLQILRVLRDERPDVFHINSSKMGGLGALAARIVGVRKIIFTSHGWAFNEPRPVWQKASIKFMAWLTIMLAHKTICISSRTKNDVGKWPFIKNKLTVIHNGITDFTIQKRTVVTQQCDRSVTVGVIAELHRIKGLDILLSAWGKFTKNHKGKLIIYGEGEEKQNLENMVRILDISDSVFLKGYVDDVRSRLFDFDIFCIPSRSEGLPYVILEAGLAELPIIATSVGGIPEIIENGINGILIPTENVEMLFSTLILLAENEDLRKRLGTSLKVSIQKNFSIKNMIEKTLTLYQN